jgi:putative transcriptional regulator
VDELPARGLLFVFKIKSLTSTAGEPSEASDTQPQMTQQEIADRVGVTRQTVIAIEQDKYSPSLETAFKVAIALGVSLEQCFQYDPSR